ncbi:hypothetical protein [Alteripontixanthobacter maritimus]|nr:hypothetical protein [Alteripontixanthobacter maritimus]
MNGGAVPVAPWQPTGAVGTDGWSVTTASPRDLSFAAVPVDRAGFDQTGMATTWKESVLLTKRVRQAYPDEAAFTADRIAVSDYIYAEDIAKGFTNGSLETSPPPIAAWIMPACELVAGSVHWEIAAYHRDARSDPITGVGRQVAAVRVRANNGTEASPWQTVGKTSISTLCQDASAMECFEGDLDIGALADGPFWLEAEVFPWFGGTGSVLKSEARTGQREFSRRWFCKNVTRAANPPMVYVASTGDDALGEVSSDSATARAKPCRTLGGAWARARTVLGNGRGTMDGLRVRVLDTVDSGSVPYAVSYPQDCAAVVVERAPETSRSNAVVRWNTHLRCYFKDHSPGITEGALTFRDCTIDRTAGWAFYGETAAPLHVQFHDVVMRNNGQPGTWRTSSHVSIFGMEMTGYANTLAQTAAGEVRILRALDADLAGGGPEAWVTLCCRLTRANAGRMADAAKGVIYHGNLFLSPVASTGPIGLSAVGVADIVGPVAVVQNLIEVTHTTAQVAAFLLAAASGASRHSVVHHNIGTGAGQLGRWNLYYDENAGGAREHRLHSFKGNLCEQLNTKGDIFAQDGTRLGQFAFNHGVGCSGNYAVSHANFPEAEEQDFAGPGTRIGAGKVLFVNDRSTSGTAEAPVAGMGGGDYHLLPESAARAIQPKPVLAFDMDGMARGGGAQAAGAYA